MKRVDDAFLHLLTTAIVCEIPLFFIVQIIRRKLPRLRLNGYRRFPIAN